MTEFLNSYDKIVTLLLYLNVLLRVYIIRFLQVFALSTQFIKQCKHNISPFGLLQVLRRKGRSLQESKKQLYINHLCAFA